MLDDATRTFLEREIERAQHPAGMSVHDGRVHIEASVIQRLLAVIDAQQAERDRLREALTFVRRGIESGHIEFSPIVLDKSGCFKQEHRGLSDVVNAAIGDANAHP